jgi:uncharacterized membrane protein
MRTKIIKDLQPLHGLIIVTLVLGVFFRFYHLDYKVYWHDEVFTSLRAAGHDGQQIGKYLKQQESFKAGELLPYQQLSPERGWRDTLASLKTHPEHPPLYYLGTRLWMELFGSTVAVTRSLAASISLLAFPCLYWLCLELFESPLVGGVAIALFAVSPFQVLYAQEARQYSLWTVAVLLSCAALLWARREQSSRSWGTYTATVALGLYTSLCFGLTLLSQGIYLAIVEKARLSKTIRAYLTALGLGLFSFIPWFMVIVQNRQQLQEKTAWVNAFTPLDFLAKLWGLHISSGFVDLGLTLEHPYTYIIPPLSIALVFFAFWVLCRQTFKEVWLFILLLIAVNVVMLIVPDVLWGGRRSSSSRYFVPTYIGVQLLMAYLISYWLTHSRAFLRQIGRFTLVALLIAGVVSCTLSAQAQMWWNKGLSYNNPAAARILNKATHPLVIISTSDDSLGTTISLSYLLKPDVMLKFVSYPEVPDLSPNECEVFLYYPSATLYQNLVKTYSGQIEFSEVEPALIRLQGKGLGINKCSVKPTSSS